MNDSPRRRFLEAIRPKLERCHKVRAENLDAWCEAVDKTACDMATHARARGKECDGELSLAEVRQMLLDCYGQECPYLPLRRLVLNDKAGEGIALDHVVPLARGGQNVRSNVQIVSRRANTLKADLSPAGWLALLEVLEGMDERDRASVEQRLMASKAAVFKGRPRR